MTHGHSPSQPTAGKSPRPQIDGEGAQRLALEHYGLECRAQELPSDSDRNFRLDTDDGERYVLKLSNSSRPPEVVDCENSVLGRLAELDPPLPCPTIVPTRELQSGVSVGDDSGRLCQLRLLTWLPGRPLAVVHAGAELLRQLGSALGRLDRALLDFDHPAAHRTMSWSLEDAPTTIDQRLGAIGDGARCDQIRSWLERYRVVTQPATADLRQSVIHNDANDYNILVQGGSSDSRFEPSRLSGLLDFGDLLLTRTVHELAIVLAYAMMDRADPVGAVAPLIAGYHQELSLEPAEVEVLFELVRLRLSLSVVMSAYQRSLEPDNEYLSISERPAWRLLDRLAAVCPGIATMRWREACGWEPLAGARSRALSIDQLDAAPILGTGVTSDQLVVIDLSIDSPLYAECEDPDDLGELDRAIRGQIDRLGRRYGVGRWDEARLWYTSELFGSPGAQCGDARTVHLGIDLFAEPGHRVYAPLDGVVHSVQDNRHRLDYGPTILLEHETEAAGTFFTLYGHLSRDSIDELEPGQPIERGQLLARLGTAEENTGWPPHLHFQIMLDLLGNSGDFPGVALPAERSAWLCVSPDPGPLLGLPEELSRDCQLSDSESLQRRRRSCIGPSLSLSYREPLHIVRGRGAHLFDVAGRRYLDLVNNVCHVGHSRPEVVQALASQAAVLNTNTRYLHENLIRYAERLIATLPEPLEVCYFVNSGSEANDLALRLARTYTGRHDTLCIDGAYHGHLSSLIEVSPYKHDGPAGSGTPSHVFKLALPDTYRGRYRSTEHAPHELTELYAADVESALARSQELGTGVAAMIVESMVSCGGQIVLPEGYLQRAFSAVRRSGGLCIADEVQVGLGRVGSHFWAFETQDVVPEIVTMGKPIGNGHPLAAVVTTRYIAEAFDNGMEYFNTYGGNPVSCAVGMAVLDVLEQEQLQQHSQRVGLILKAGLERLADAYAQIGDVRGLGLFVGFELIEYDQRSLSSRPAPDAELAAFLVERMKRRGFLLSTDGPDHNVIKIKPPMVITEKDVERFLCQLEQVCARWMQ